MKIKNIKWYHILLGCSIFLILLGPWVWPLETTFLTTLYLVIQAGGIFVALGVMKKKGEM